MKRTNSWFRFFVQNRRLLLLLILPLIGCVCGMVLYGSLPEEWAALLPLRPVEGTLAGVLSDWLSTRFQPICLLVLLWIAGLSACGAPLIVCVPVFWGLGLGLYQACCLQDGPGGWLRMALMLLPAAVLELVALLMACSEALRMTLLVAVQLLPRSARCGGLWPDFRLYSLRFLLLLALLLGAGALDVLLRLVCGGMLSP